MTDRTPASPVEDAARRIREYMEQQGDIGWTYHGIAEAALQAQDHTITKGGLDVERLAEAMHRRHPESILIGCLRHDRHDAEWLAREYAALEPTHD